MGQLEARGVDYVILGSLHRNEIGRLQDLLAANCASFRVEASFPPRTYVFRVGDGRGVTQDAGATQPDACEAIATHARANVDRTFNETWRKTP